MNRRLPRIGTGPWGRTRLVATTTLVAVVVTLGTGAAPSGAQSDPEPTEIRNGTAVAIAGIGKYAPGVGQLELGMTSGTSIAQVTNFLGQASAQNTDLGLIGLAATSEDCEGNATFTEEDLPQATTVDNRGGDASATRDELGTTGSPLGGGRMYVEAHEDPPSALAETTLSDLGLEPALSFGGGTSHAEAHVLPGEGREAYAQTSGDLSIGAGAVTMSGMVWHARHRTGVDPVAEAGFEYGTSTVGGQSYDPSQVAAFEAAANTALAELGMTITFPRVVRITDPSDIIRVTPMRIEIRDTPVGKAVLGPVLDASRDQRKELFDTIVELYCNASSAFLVGDIFISVISGTGFFTVEFGGASASSSDLEVFDPFASTGGLPFEGDAPDAATDAAPAPSGRPSSTPTVAPPVSGVTPTVGSVDVDDVVPVAAGPLDEFCESVHAGDGCRDDAAIAVGILGLLATVGAAGADIVRQRRPSTPAGV